MVSCRRVELLALVSILFVFPVVHGWGVDGHLTVCRIAQCDGGGKIPYFKGANVKQSILPKQGRLPTKVCYLNKARLSKAASDAVKKLLPAPAENDLGSVCSWADQIRLDQYKWSTALHYINTPDCSYKYSRDCKDENGVHGRCVVGAINNYTSQLLNYDNDASYIAAFKYNLTEALLFLSHLIGDIHQPLHVGFTSDRGGNTIDVTWYTRKSVLHRVWDDNISETAEERFYNSTVDGLIDAIQKNIKTKWANEVRKWEKCSRNKLTCPDIYASESIKAACNWAYKGLSEDSVLEDDYFLSRLPIVIRRLAQGGVRLAATLNGIFGPKYI